MCFWIVFDHDSQDRSGYNLGYENTSFYQPRIAMSGDPDFSSLNQCANSFERWYHVATPPLVFCRRI